MFPTPSKAPRFREPALPGGARGRSRLRAIGVWGLVAVGTVAALWPVRLPAATSSPIQANRRSLLFAGEDVAALIARADRAMYDALKPQDWLTTVVEPAMAPHASLQTHLELNDVPIIDKGALTVLGNDDFLLRMLRKGEAESAQET